jgi:hypothetical protein
VSQAPTGKHSVQRENRIAAPGGGTIAARRCSSMASPPATAPSARAWRQNPMQRENTAMPLPHPPPATVPAAPATTSSAAPIRRPLAGAAMIRCEPQARHARMGQRGIAGPEVPTRRNTENRAKRVKYAFAALRASPRTSVLTLQSRLDRTSGAGDSRTGGRRHPCPPAPKDV